MLRTTLETLEGVDDALKALYAEKDGTFILQLEGVDAHPDVANLKSAYERTKADRDTARQERDQYKEKASAIPEDFDAEKWAKLKDGKVDEAALVQVRKTLEAERDEWKGKAEAAQAKALQTAIDRDLTDALTTAGVTNATFVKAARSMLSGQIKMNDDGAAIVETDMGPLALSDHVQRWAAGEGKDFVTAASGGGSRGGTGGTKGGNSLVEKVPALADLPEK